MLDRRLPSLVTLVVWIGGGALAACTLAACTPKRAPVVPNVPVDDGEDSGMDRTALARDLEVTIREAYAALSDGYEERYLDGLARDRRLVLIDVGPEDVLVGFDVKACRICQQFDDRRVELRSKRLEVHITADGTSGWSFDELSYRVVHEGRRVIIPMRSTGVYERRNGRWLVVQQHVSYGVPDAELGAYAAAGRGGRPLPLESWTAPGEPAAQARAVLETAAGGGDAALATGDATLVLGSDPDAEWRGPAAAAHGSLRSQYGDDKKFEIRDLRVKTSATGQLAWAAANVIVASQYEGKPVSLPLRITWVLEHKDGVWRVVQLHTSVPVPAEELSLRVFGTSIT